MVKSCISVASCRCGRHRAARCGNSNFPMHVGHIPDASDQRTRLLDRRADNPRNLSRGQFERGTRLGGRVIVAGCHKASVERPKTIISIAILGIAGRLALAPLALNLARCRIALGKVMCVRAKPCGFTSALKALHHCQGQIEISCLVRGKSRRTLLQKSCTRVLIPAVLRQVLINCGDIYRRRPHPNSNHVVAHSPDLEDEGLLHDFGRDGRSFAHAHTFWERV